jgi:hypothetical protein
MLNSMKTFARFLGLFNIALCLAVAMLGCNGESTRPADPKKDPDKITTPPAITPEDQSAWAGSKKTPMKRGVWIETKGERRRVLVDASVCLREGQYGLECLLCRANTKEHESILRTEADARVIHIALMGATGVKPGSPVQYDPEFKPPAGSPIKVLLQYHEMEEPPLEWTAVGGPLATLFDKQGKLVTVAARTWIHNVKTKKDLDLDWVFTGSFFYKDPFDKNKEHYAAQSEGAFISVSNVPTAMLDLPVASPKGIEDRVFVPHTERIPPLDTPVTVILEAAPAPKK